MRNLSRGKIIITCALVLLCLVVISTYLVGGIFAKYLKNTETVDSARVMKFGKLTVTETGVSAGTATGQKTFMIEPGVPITKDPKVVFDGTESTAFVFVKATIGSGWTSSDYRSFSAGPENELNWSIDSSWTYLTTETGGANVYYMALEPNVALSGQKIITDSKISVSEFLYHSELTALSTANLNITFEAYAIQSNGFDGVSNTWTALSGRFST